MKQRILKTIPYVITFFLGVYVIEILTSYVMGLSQFKAQISEHSHDILMNAIQHPLLNIQMYIQQHNPLMILGSLALLAYLFYFAMKRHAKKQDWKTADEQTHGSATWGNEKTLVNDGHYFKIKEKTLQNEFAKSIDSDVINKIKKSGSDK